MRFRIWYLYITLGILFAICTVMLIYMAASLYVDDARGKDIDMTGDVVVFCCMPFFLPEAIFFLVLGIFTKRRAKNLRILAARLDSYRIIKISDLAQKMGKSEKKARKMVRRCIKKKYVKGRLDEEEETFFTTEYLENTPNIINGWKCSNCENYSREIILPGEVGRCPSCGDLLDNSVKEISTINGEDLLPPDKKKKEVPNKAPIEPRKIEPPAAVQEMIAKYRGQQQQASNDNENTPPDP